MSIAWDQAEKTIRTWVKTAAGVADSKVIFADQDGKCPSDTYLAIRFGDVVPLGLDEVQALTDLARAAGSEIEHRVQGQREFTLSVQAFSLRATGQNSARSLLSRVQTALSLPTVIESFAAIGISNFDAGRIQNLSAVAGGDFEGRAALETRWYANEHASEFIGYIATCVPISYLGPPGLGTVDDIDI